MAKRKPPARRRRSSPPKRRARTRSTTSSVRRRGKPRKKANTARKRVRTRPRAAATTRPSGRKPGKGTTPRRPSPATPPRPAPLERRRRQLPDEERLSTGRNPADDRLLSSARAGHDELEQHLTQHTETSPAMTAGDIDAKWEEAYALGDEAPGGDNPTPGQDRVDDIGKALGIQYLDSEELQGGDEVTERDKHRWELDPASSDDWPHKK